MFRLPLLVLVSLAIAFGGGAWSAIAALRAFSGFGAISLGAWKAFPEIQTANADPYAKAHRASDGRLLLGRAEGLLFAADSDSSGATLSGLCSYELEGRTPPARFWTLRVTDGKGRPLRARKGYPSSLNSWQIVRGADGVITISVSDRAQPGNWLAVETAEPFRLVLTLIDTPAAASNGLAVIDMPSITSKRCRDA